MRKLFENHIFHYSFVLTMVAFACGLVIGGVNAITSPIIEENRTRAQIEAYERVLPGISEFTELDRQGDPSTIISKVEGRNANGDIIGYIYVAYGTNKFGYMRIISSVALDGKILGASFLEINQTYNVNDTRTNLSLYEGRNITEVAPVGDMISGVTGSKNTLVDLMADIARAHARMDIITVDPFNDWFDVAYTRINDDSFQAESSVVARQIVKNDADEIIAYIYEIVKTGIYFDSSSSEITVFVGVDLNQDIFGILIPRDTYNHTKGYMQEVISFAINTYVGINLSEVVALSDGDLAAGATNSSRLVSLMLIDLKEVVLS
jgi:hypothetical protein